MYWMLTKTPVRSKRVPLIKHITISVGKYMNSHQCGINKEPALVQVRFLQQATYGKKWFNFRSFWISECRQGLWNYNTHSLVDALQSEITFHTYCHKSVPSCSWCLSDSPATLGRLGNSSDVSGWSELLIAYAVELLVTWSPSGWDFVPERILALQRGLG